MIIVDGNYFARRFFHMAQGENDNKNMNSMDYFRHTFLLNLNSIKYKYQKDYGKIVLAIDYKSWRKDFYPEYKDNRKDKEEDPLSLEFIKIFDDIICKFDEKYDSVIYFNAIDGDYSFDDIVLTGKEYKK